MELLALLEVTELKALMALMRSWVMELMAPMGSRVAVRMELME